jgi:hypothetical protein
MTTAKTKTATSKGPFHKIIEKLKKVMNRVIGQDKYPPIKKTPVKTTKPKVKPAPKKTTVKSKIDTTRKTKPKVKTEV